MSLEGSQQQVRFLINTFDRNNNVNFNAQVDEFDFGQNSIQLNRINKFEPLKQLQEYQKHLYKSKGRRRKRSIQQSYLKDQWRPVIYTRKNARPTSGSPQFASTSATMVENVSNKTTSLLSFKPVTDVCAGALARAASQSTIHPLDTIKVRMQAGKMANIPHFQKQEGIVNKIIVASREVQSLYKGVQWAAGGAGIAIGAYFAFYSTSVQVLQQQTTLPPGGVAFLSGAFAAAGSSVVKVPLAVCIRSVQAGLYQNPFEAAFSISKRAGTRGLFTGYVPTLIEDVPDMAFKFAAYESLRRIYSHLQGGRRPTSTEDFTIGAVSGAIAAAATTPLDVIKTTMMCQAHQRPSMVSASTQIYKQGGYWAFMNGVGARALSNGMNSAVFFCFFEAIRRSIYQYRKRKELQNQCVYNGMEVAIEGKR